MVNVVEVERHYSNLHESELQQLAQNPGDLKSEFLPLLQKELMKRELFDDAINVTVFLQNELNKRNPGCPDPTQITKQAWRTLIAGFLLIGVSVYRIIFDFVQDVYLIAIIDIFFLFLGFFMLADAIGNFKKAKKLNSETI